MADKQADLKPEETATNPGASTSVEHTEPEDQYAAGGQQQDQKQVLKKSVKDQQAPSPVPESAGLHSTGSYTGTAGGPGSTPKR